MTTAQSTPRRGTRAALADDVIALLFQLRRRFQAALPAGLHEELQRVTSHQMEAVGCLIHSDGLTMHELARNQGCALSTATALADRLIKSGLADRVNDPSDRRVVRLVATPRAMELKAQFMEAKREVALHSLRSLDVAEMETLARLLRKVLDAEETARG